MKKSILFAFAFVSLYATSCSDDEGTGWKEPENSTTSNCAYILTQGNFYNNIEGGLDVLNYGKGISTSVFKAANRRSIGDTPQCGVAYRDKIYIGVSESNTIEILDAKTYASIKQIRLSQDDTYGSTPRWMVAYGEYVYVSMFDGHVARLSTNTLEFDAAVTVGPNPDIMALYNGKLYVPITNGMDYPNYDKRVQIVNPITMTVEETIEVGLNPTEVIAAEGHLYVLTKGDYTTVPSELKEIMPDNSVKVICEATIVAACGSDALIIDQQFDETGVPTANYLKYDAAADQTVTWDVAEKPLYANSIFYDKAQQKVLIASYIMNGLYPSYDLPGYVNEYSATDMRVINTYDLGTAGPACIFTMQK